jgi:hypothetical protein
VTATERDVSGLPVRPLLLPRFEIEVKSEGVVESRTCAGRQTAGQIAFWLMDASEITMNTIIKGGYPSEPHEFSSSQIKLPHTCTSLVQRTKWQIPD